MQNNSPSVAIVVPCWNSEKYLPELLDSVLAQTYQNWELYAIDDQSLDKTVAILEEYHFKDPRIKYYTRDREPKGAQTCRNIGLNLASEAKYLMFIDSDDILAPNCLEQRVHYMENHPELDFSVFPAKVFSKKISDEKDFLIGFNVGEDEIASFCIPILPFSVWNNIYKTASIINYNIRWDEHLLSWQDHDFILQALLSGLNYHYSGQAQIDYFWRNDSNSHSTTTKIKSPEHYKSHIYFFDKLYQRLTKQQKKIYNLFIQYRLLTYSELFRKDKRAYQEFTKLAWIRNNFTFRLKLAIYAIFPINNKIKRILFPRLISTYLQSNSKHVAILKCKQRQLIKTANK